MRRTMLTIAGSLELSRGLAWAQKTTLDPRRPAPVVPDQFTDSGEFIADTCPMMIAYTVSAPQAFPGALLDLGVKTGSFSTIFRFMMKP